MTLDKLFLFVPRLSTFLKLLIMPSFRRLTLESLEQKLPMFATSGTSWADHTVTYSFMPDGADVQGSSNELFAKLNEIAPTDVWQREVARALQTWANVADLNFYQVPDNGAASGSGTVVQGNPDFGDIRIATRPLDLLAFSYFPHPTSTLGGDIRLGLDTDFRIGQTFDLFSVVVHESGHSLGLDHFEGGILSPIYTAVVSGLTDDDIAGIQSIYGPRVDDAFDAARPNNDKQSATELGSDHEGGWELDLTSMDDVDYFSVNVPGDSDGTLTVSVVAQQVSLLAPKLVVMGPNGKQVASVEAAFGETAKLELEGLKPGGRYYIVADGATQNEFGMGAYRLEYEFGLQTRDRLETNDTMLNATHLGRFDNHSEHRLTIHDEGDADFFKFSTRRAGNYRIAVVSRQQVTVRLYDELGRVVASSSTGYFDEWLFGTFYLEVEAESGGITYDLLITNLAGRRSRGVRWWDTRI